jgi:DNA-binding IclR family transcriptional regulator
LGTVGKALQLLDLFTQVRPSIGLSDLARLAGVNKATCFRLMAELQAAGLVEQAGPAREYRLGPAVLGLAARREAHVPTRDAALPVLHRLAEVTGETAHLSHRVGGDLRTLAFAYGAQHGIRVMMEDADILPWTRTASGLVVLAHLAPADREPILALAPVDSARLAAIQAEGLTTAEGTFETDVIGTAAPLFGPDGTCRGAVAVAAPAVRATPAARASIAAHLGQAAADITALWGGPARKDPS